MTPVPDLPLLPLLAMRVHLARTRLSMPQQSAEEASAQQARALRGETSTRVWDAYETARSIVEAYASAQSGDKNVK